MATNATTAMSLALGVLYLSARSRQPENELQIELSNLDRGEVKETVPIELEGDPVTVGFNVRYLGEILGVIPDDKITLELAHPLAPCLVKGTDDDTAFYVVMPMRLD